MSEEEEALDLHSRPLTQAKRVLLMERDVRSHARSLGELVTNDAKLERRVSALEEWKMQRQIAEAREDERDIALGARLTRIEQSIEHGVAGLEHQIRGIKNFGWRIFWIAAVPAVGGLVIVVALGIVYAPKLAGG